jgi:hypothetical protein
VTVKVIAAAFTVGDEGTKKTWINVDSTGDYTLPVYSASSGFTCDSSAMSLKILEETGD